MNISKDDLFWYAGMMLGTSAAFVGLEALAVEPRWLRLVIAIVIGIGVGWFAQTTFGPKDAGRGDPGEGSGQ